MRLIDADALYDKAETWYKCAPIPYRKIYRRIVDSIADAPTITPPPNNPLTLEELREMDGEPVWNDTMKKYALVDLTWEYGDRTVDAEGRWRGLDDRYYRRKPEEGTT